MAPQTGNSFRQFGDNHKVKLGKKRSKTNGVKLSKMASGLWVSLRYTSPLVTLQPTHAWERSGQGAKSGWLSPIEIDETSDAIGADLSQLSGQDARRASSKGFLNLTLEFYLDLLDWIGRNLAAGKRGAPNNPGVLKKSYRRLSVSHFNSDSIRL